MIKFIGFFGGISSLSSSNTWGISFVVPQENMSLIKIYQSDLSPREPYWEVSPRKMRHWTDISADFFGRQIRQRDRFFMRNQSFSGLVLLHKSCPGNKVFLRQLSQLVQRWHQVHGKEELNCISNVPLKCLCFCLSPLTIIIKYYVVEFENAFIKWLSWMLWI